MTVTQSHAKQPVELKGLQSHFVMNDANTIPRLGLGVYMSEAGKEAEDAVVWALQAGYRHIDTATNYGNEASVGEAIRRSGVPREEVFVTTKLTEDDQGYDSAIAALNLSLEKMGLDYVDLYLIHSPLRGTGPRLASWKAFETLVEQGKAKSIGVSNYGIHHLQELFDTNPKIRPSVNQIEVNPWLRREEIVAFCESQHIAVEAYCPLAKAKKLEDPVVNQIANKYSKSPAQVLIRWSLQMGYVVIPKSVKKERIEHNADVYDFVLADEDMTLLNALNENFICSWDPTIEP
ncbi:hypothetical protein BGZ99_009633 [Dissophora globulifera]|uniref:NADP-dependent oxidoreductase domain-containing protein n=1 Tax=Dissophora globulifera TaxID=979702 RepID=A0A9P6UZ05_9FUNG|nr:hypothetical protein BGZ99_009633 [Dissophora globulifera]